MASVARRDRTSGRNGAARSNKIIFSKSLFEEHQLHEIFRGDPCDPPLPFVIFHPSSAAQAWGIVHVMMQQFVFSSEGILWILQ